FLVLIFHHLVTVTPALLIPRGFNEASTFDTVAFRQILTVATEQPSGLRMIDPHPCRPKDCRHQRFCVTRRNVDDQVPDSTIRHGLQMRTDRIHVDAANERSPWLQNMPRLCHKLLEAESGCLRHQSPQLELW